METIRLTYPLRMEPSRPAIALAIGYFDGVHLGHQAVIGRARRFAEDQGIATGVMTFHPHPREVLGKAKMNHYLTPLPEKLNAFEALGVDRTYVMAFDREFASLSKEAFIEEVLAPLNVRGAAVGFNFSFGRGAEGKAEDLVRLGEGKFRVEVTPPIDQNELPLSSTRLRQAVREGRVDIAGQILGRPYALAGEVVHGDRRGRLIGFPTANLRLGEPYMVPDHGVYVVQASWGNTSRYGIMNIGVRPTFDDPTPRLTLEVHLLDTDVDLYGKQLRVEFLHRLRPEVKFDSVDALVDRIRKDEREARAWLERKKSSSC
ncbi:bifunctional riboflavin kinase/FAD synthetase [Paludifilum halophilum]|uniref:Riboflavin biosynthesis protein n=1 Tax=Paludifilum halophilum TaxID=1642702 RepID=A0A235BE99_9BACL|nr:bifunctional riboflavin kinase/FAD synthetase [Paludifilum halophilum]OYD09945.1 riboflavin biosynthesis protein RibF [Paludifilum halophilum]